MLHSQSMEIEGNVYQYIIEAYFDLFLLQISPFFLRLSLIERDVP